MMTEAIWLAIISAGTAIIGYVIGMIKNSSSSTSKNFETLYNTLLQANKELREQNSKAQSRIADLEEQVSSRRRHYERDLRKLRQENLEQAQQLAIFRSFWRDFNGTKEIKPDVKKLLFERNTNDKIPMVIPGKQVTKIPSQFIDVTTEEKDRHERTPVEEYIESESPRFTPRTVTTVSSGNGFEDLNEEDAEGWDEDGWDNFSSDRPTKKFRK